MEPKSYQKRNTDADQMEYMPNNHAEIDNRDTPFAIRQSYAKALKRIRAPEAIRILAAKTTFEEAWQSGSSGEALKARYDFKHVSASEACRQHGNLYQVRFIRKYRALLAFSNDGKQCWWLDVFLKQNEAEQERRIESACDRALRLLEQHQS
jgi:hypothetical protein